MPDNKLPVKFERETSLYSSEVAVEVTVRFRNKRYPMTVDAARTLRDQLNETLRPRG